MADLVQLPLADIDTNGNIRTDLGDLADMTRSVSDLGVLTPVTVYRNADRQWVLLAGHRRVEAALRAGLSTVPALDIGDEPPDEDRLVIALVENLLREDLNPIDEARAYQQLASRGWSTRKIAAKLHIHHSHVASRLSLLALPPDLQSTVTTGDTKSEARIPTRPASQRRRTTRPAHRPRHPPPRGRRGRTRGQKTEEDTAGPDPGAQGRRPTCRSQRRPAVPTNPARAHPC